MKLQALALLALLAVASAVQTEEEIFAQISKENPFGQAVSALVQMTAQSSNKQPSGRLSEINSMLEEFREQLLEVQTNAQTTHENRMAECNTTLAQYTQTITEQETRLNDAQEEMSVLREEKTTKSQELTDKRTSFEQIQNDIAAYQEQIAEENSTYTEHRSSFEEAIQACETAIRLLTELARGHSTASSFAQNGIMFVQLSQKFEAVKNLLEETKKSHNVFVQPIIDVLMELGQSSHVDLEQVQQIIGLIQTLLARLREGLVERQNQHEHTITSLQNLISDLQGQMRTSTTSIETYEERIESIDERLESLGTVVGNLEDVLTLTRSLKESLTTECTEDSESYVREEAKREQSLATLDRLIQYFQSQVVTTTTEVRDSSYQDSLGN